MLFDSHPRVSINVVRMKSIPFTLKEDTKRWPYGLKVGSILSWNFSIDAFLRRYFLIIMTIRLKSEITSFVLLEQKPFWRSMNRFKELLTKCSHYGLERWNFPNCL